MERFTKDRISNVSWRDCLSQDPYYWLENSFQYSENINVDDELHGIKLSQKVLTANVCANCQLISAWDHVFALDKQGTQNVKYFNKDNRTSPTTTSRTVPSGSAVKTVKGTIFQDYLRFWFNLTVPNIQAWAFKRGRVTWAGNADIIIPQDHIESTDESISTYNQAYGESHLMPWNITSILNYNNTRLVVGAGRELRVYYPELDMTGTTQNWHTVAFGETGWKKVQQFEAGCNIIALTCDFQFLRVRVQDEGWNTKMFYYQGNNDLRNTFVYNLVDLTNTKVLNVYPINWVDYFTASLDGTDGYITLNKITGTQSVQIFKQRAGLSQYDPSNKNGYFVWPTAIDSSYLDGAFYIADYYGVFKFLYDPQGIDKGYLKWKFRSNHTSNTQPTGLTICQNFLYVSDREGIKRMRLYDTGVDGYQSKGILVSREMEGNYGWCICKILDEVRCHFEFNHFTNSSSTGTIDVYVSPNNLRELYDPEVNSNGWIQVMHIDNDSKGTRYEKTNTLNSLDDWKPAFETDRETITYCVVIKSGGTSVQRTPAVREIQMTYHTKGKTNNVYNIN